MRSRAYTGIEITVDNSYTSIEKGQLRSRGREDDWIVVEHENYRNNGESWSGPFFVYLS